MIFHKRSVGSGQIIDGSIAAVDVAADLATQAELDVVSAVASAAASAASLATHAALTTAAHGGIAPLASPTFTGTLAAANIQTSGTTLLGDAAGDTFKVHGASSASGLQGALLADVTINLGDVPGTLTAIGVALNGLLAIQKNHGLMAAS